MQPMEESEEEKGSVDSDDEDDGFGDDRDT